MSLKSPIGELSINFVFVFVFALNYGLVFKADGTDPILTGYSDADWGGDVSTRGSTTGFVFQIQGNTISWCSRRQAFFARLTT